MSSFASAESTWADRLGNLRNVIRQELVARQLGPFVRDGATVLDVGCGQGTQALRLAARGCRVTGVDPSRQLLATFDEAATAAGTDVELLEGSLDQLDELLGSRTFEVVCAHGLLMYLNDPRAAIASLARRLAPAATLSITFRNAHALAFRPAMRGDWSGALAAFEGFSYVGELGVEARADHLPEIEAALALAGVEIAEWFGIRVFNDHIASDATVPERADLELLLKAEDQAGRRDPYRWLASQLHVVGRRATASQEVD